MPPCGPLAPPSMKSDCNCAMACNICACCDATSDEAADEGGICAEDAAAKASNGFWLSRLPGCCCEAPKARARLNWKKKKGGVKLIFDVAKFIKFRLQCKF